MSSEKFVPGRAAVACELRVEGGPDAAAFCRGEMCSGDTLAGKGGHQGHLHWVCGTGPRIWWILAMELWHLYISHTLYCKSWCFSTHGVTIFQIYRFYSCRVMSNGSEV